ncbi:hypothetical protein PI124_g16956 [Phytophthora idaei]|nr:hypothetical protein PI125_g17244 [Phytophthora idaei]KAG3139796.1 hypothetical protein PI126_g16296 [Phytophthora idaei]KAG3238071.1 hypothetical protein PI124_g16956 [Phytophthora idaei]
MRNAVYVKNRVFNKGTQGVLYKWMFSVKPDVHHVRKFEALVYVHVPVALSRRKHYSNTKIGFVLRYAEGVIGGKVFSG